MILTPNITTVYRSPKSCFFAEHDGQKVLRKGNGMISSSNKIICADEESEVDSEISRLGLIVVSKREKAKALFLSLDPATQHQFGPVFQAVSAIPQDEDAALAIEAVTVPDSLKPVQKRLVALLRS